MNALVVILVGLAPILSAVSPPDGAVLYKSKCAACHGAAGEGIMAPPLQSTTLTQRQITDLLTKGAETRSTPHDKAISGLTPPQATAIATYVGTLKK